MAAKIKEEQSARIPLEADIGARNYSTAVDGLAVNGFFEPQKDRITGEVTYNFVKRAGLNAANIMAGGVVGRGLRYWPANGTAYSVWGSGIYAGNTLIQTMTTSTGKCGIEEISPSAGTPYMCVNDGVKLYIINAVNTVTTITTNFPTPNNGDLVYMDGVLVTSKSNGTFYHCDVEDPTTWNPTKFLTAEMYNDGLTRMFHQNNLLGAIGPKSIEFFYNAGNASGSIFSKADQAVQRIGCTSPNSIAIVDNFVCFVGRAEGGYSVYRLEGLTDLKKISTPNVDRILGVETNPLLNSAYSVITKVGGHYIYLLNLVDQLITLAYDFLSDTWTRWKFQNTEYFPFIEGSYNQNHWYLQHVADGNIYVNHPTLSTDNGTNYTCSVITPRIDFGTTKRKFVDRLELVGDKQSSTTNVDIYYSDDDYQTWVGPRTYDLSNTRTFSRAWGNFRRRAFKVQYTGANPFRIGYLDMDYKLGD